MSHTAHGTNQGLLSYAISTNPDPILASPAQGTPSLTSLVIVVSNTTTAPIYCNKITFSFSIGDLAQDLTNEADGIKVSANPSDQWQISSNGDGTFTATPVKPENNKLTTDGLTFQIYNIQANSKVGTFTVNVDELSSSDNASFSDKNNAYDLAKFPYGFYVNHFASSTPMVKHGDSVNLTWSGSDLAQYTILYDSTSVVATDIRSWQSPSLTDTTTFALKATMQEEGESVETYLYLTVIVSQPDLNATSLTVTGKATVGQLYDALGPIMPQGAILMWSGDSDSVPDGWTLCDGSKDGVPDLRNRFIVGAGDSYKPKETGGNSSVTLTGDNMPSHDHDAGSFTVMGTNASSVNFPRVNAHADWGWQYLMGTDDAKDEAEVKSLPSSGEDDPDSFDILPPYFALCFIMKL